MKAKHTPGPWEVSEGAGTVLTPDTLIRFSIDPKGRDGFCNRLANARLIAAAPELLAALKEANKYLHGVVLNGGMFALEKSLKRYEKAIAKAEGEQ